LSDANIDEIMESCSNVQGKIFYSRLKEMNQIARNGDKQK